VVFRYEVDPAATAFIAKTGIEALDVSVLPGAAWCDVGSLGANRCDPLLYGLGHKLRPIVGPDVVRDTTKDEEVGQHIDHIDGFELAGDPDRQAFVGELVDHIEHSILPSVVGAVLDEVVEPDVIAVFGPQPDARSVRQPEPATLGLFMGDLQPLASPNPFDPFVVHNPARLLQQPSYLAIAVPKLLRSSPLDAMSSIDLRNFSITWLIRVCRDPPC
jgi:hypothetical protein